MPTGNSREYPPCTYQVCLYLMLKENSYQFRGSNYLKTSGTAMGTKKAIAFANPFIAWIENQILSQSCIEPCHQRIFSRMWWEASVLAAGRQIFGQRQNSPELKPQEKMGEKRLFMWVTIKTLPNRKPCIKSLWAPRVIEPLFWKQYIDNGLFQKKSTPPPTDGVLF